MDKNIYTFKQLKIISCFEPQKKLIQTHTVFRWPIEVELGVYKSLSTQEISTFDSRNCDNQGKNLMQVD